MRCSRTILRILSLNPNNKKNLLKPLDFKKFQKFELGYAEASMKYLKNSNTNKGLCRERSVHHPKC